MSVSIVHVDLYST